MLPIVAATITLVRRGATTVPLGAALSAICLPPFFSRIHSVPRGAHGQEAARALALAKACRRGEWREYSPDKLLTYLRTTASDPHLSAVKIAACAANEAFDTAPGD